MKMSGSNGGRVHAVMCGDLEEDSDEEQAGAPCGRVEWLADDGELFHLENEPFLGKYFE